MKKIVCMLLAMAMLGLSVAGAELNYNVYEGAISRTGKAETATIYDGGLTFAAEPTFTQNCVVHVKIVHTNPDGTTNESVISPVVFTVTYKFQIYKRSGVLSGGEMLRGEWPLVALTGYSTYDLGVSVAKVSTPENASVSVSGNSYTCSVSGGLLQVTYYPVIYIDANGVATHADPVTQDRAYYGVFNGSVE